MTPENLNWEETISEQFGSTVVQRKDKRTKIYINTNWCDNIFMLSIWVSIFRQFTFKNTCENRKPYSCEVCVSAFLWI